MQHTSPKLIKEKIGKDPTNSNFVLYERTELDNNTYVLKYEYLIFGETKKPKDYLITGSKIIIRLSKFQKKEFNSRIEGECIDLLNTFSKEDIIHGTAQPI